MEDERWHKHTSAFDIKSSSGKRRKIDNNRRKKEAEKRGGEVASFSSVLFSASFFLPSFFLLLLSIFLLLPEEDLMSKALVCLYHRSSSIGEYSFLVLFLTCVPHQQLLAFPSFHAVRFFSLACDDLGRMFIHSFPACAFLSSFFKVEISSRTLIPLFMPESPQWLSEIRRLWSSVPRGAACELVPWQVPTLSLDSGRVSPLRLCWVKGVSVFRCNLPPALLAKWPGSFTCHCGYTEVGRDTEQKSAHKVDSGEGNSPAGVRTRNLSITSPALYQQAIPTRCSRIWYHNMASPLVSYENLVKM